VSCIGTSHAKSPEGVEIALFGGDFTGSLCWMTIRDGNGSTGGGGLEVLGLDEIYESTTIKRGKL
jgi:hypothetical protein